MHLHTPSHSYTLLHAPSIDTLHTPTCIPHARPQALAEGQRAAKAQRLDPTDALRQHVQRLEREKAEAEARAAAAEARVAELEGRVGKLEAELEAKVADARAEERSCSSPSSEATVALPPEATRRSLREPKPLRSGKPRIGIGRSYQADVPEWSHGDTGAERGDALVHDALRAVHDALRAERAAFNTALLQAEPRRRWPDNGTARVALSQAPADALCRFLREPRDARGHIEIGGRTYTGYYGYRATAAVEAGRKHDGKEQEKRTLLLDDMEHARDHLPGLDALAHGAQCCLPEPMDLLHGHVLDQTSKHTCFSDHQDTEENRRKGARKPDREVVYTVVLKLSREGDTAMRILGREPVDYEAAPGTGVCFRSELWHRTERASEGTMKVTLFFGRWL